MLIAPQPGGHPVSGLSNAVRPVAEVTLASHALGYLKVEQVSNCKNELQNQA